jgi:glycosyltransferase 2 family protein
VMILRWVLLLRASGNPITTADATRLFLISSFVGSFLPAGVGGDAARAWGLSQVSARMGDALASVVVDRMLGILSLAAMGAAGLAAWTPGGIDPVRIIAAVAVLGLACVAAFWGDAMLRWALPAHRHGGPVARRMLRLADAVARYRGHRGALASVMAWSLAVQVLRIVQAWVLGLGLGLTVPFAYYLLVMPLGLLMLLLPISVSGFGVPQGVLVWLLRPMGVADTASFALSTLIVLTGLAGNLPGLVLWLRRPAPPR